MLDRTISPPLPALPPPAGVSDERAQAIGLVFACPVNMDNPASCPLHTLRRQPPADKFSWVRRLAQHELRDLVARHAACRIAGAEPRPTTPGGCHQTGLPHEPPSH